MFQNSTPDAHEQNCPPIDVPDGRTFVLKLSTGAVTRSLGQVPSLNAPCPNGIHEGRPGARQTDGFGTPGLRWFRDLWGGMWDLCALWGFKKYLLSLAFTWCFIWILPTQRIIDAASCCACKGGAHCTFQRHCCTYIRCINRMLRTLWSSLLKHTYVFRTGNTM